MAIDHAKKKTKKQVGQVQTGLTHPFLWMSGKSKKVEAAGRVFFPLAHLSRKIERDSARRVFQSEIADDVLKFDAHLSQ